jgi:aryl-alcohol dehydrogenase-like predicted oxidoreductase
MAQVSPVRALEHANGRAMGAEPSLGVASARAAIAPASPVVDAPVSPVLYDSSATVPLPIVAPRRLGDTSLAVYPLALGTKALAESADVTTAHAVLDRFVERGGDLIVTSDAHARGLGNAIVGGWMHARDQRDNVVLALQIGAGGHEGAGLGPVNVVRSVESALRHLGTDHVDLLTLQGPDVGTALSDTLATAEWLIDTGKVHHLALSGYSADSLMEARILSSTGLPRIAAIEVPYSLMHRHGFEGDLRIVTAAQGLGVLPTHPLAHGYLAGASRGRSYLSRRGHRVLHVLDRVAAQHGCGMATVAVAWLLAKRGVVAPVVNVAAAIEVDALMDAFAISLTRAEMLDLDRASE